MLRHPTLSLWLDPVTGRIWHDHVRVHGGWTSTGKPETPYRLRPFRNGYYYVPRGRKFVKASRIALECTLGRVLAPGETVDHLNFNRQDDRPENLRPLSHRDNSARKSPRPVRSPSGFAGVRRLGRKWAAHIDRRPRSTYLGVFDTIHQAVEARETALAALERKALKC